MLQLNEIESFEFDDRMSDSDALMWSIEKDPLLRSTIVTVSTFEGRLDHDRVRHQIDYLSRVIPRFRQRVRANPLSIAPPRWEFDPYFDLSYHLRFVTVSEGATLADVLTMAEPIGMQGFDRARPLWEATIVDGLADGTTALILKIHHSITDGVGGMKLQLALFDLAPDDPKPELPDAPDIHVLSQPERVADAVTYETQRSASLFASWAKRGLGGAMGVITDPVGALAGAEELTESVFRLVKPASPLSPLITERSLSVRFATLQFPLPIAKAAMTTTPVRERSVGAMSDLRQWLDGKGHGGSGGGVEPLLRAVQCGGPPAVAECRDSHRLRGRSGHVLLPDEGEILGDPWLEGSQRRTVDCSDDLGSGRVRLDDATEIAQAWSVHLEARRSNPGLDRSDGRIGHRDGHEQEARACFGWRERGDGVRGIRLLDRDVERRGARDGVHCRHRHRLLGLIRPCPPPGEPDPGEEPASDEKGQRAAVEVVSEQAEESRHPSAGDPTAGSSGVWRRVGHARSVASDVSRSASGYPSDEVFHRLMPLSTA